MLILQRASAGSGKTYALAKTFIRHLIAVRDDSAAHYRLRSDAELHNSLEHILAVTFTNKATAEMQTRIVEKLHALATYDVAKLPDADGKYPDAPDYLNDFTAELDCSAPQIARAAQIALGEVLMRYSFFNISTIDSFFQNIIRTFTFEVELPDNFQLVVEDEYLPLLGATSLADAVSLQNNLPEIRFWLEVLMKGSLGAGGDWNLFAQNKSRANNAFSVIYKTARMLQNEHFQTLSDIIGSYKGDLRKIYTSLDADFTSRTRKAFTTFRDSLQILHDFYCEVAPHDTAKAVSYTVTRWKQLTKYLTPGYNPELLGKWQAFGKSAFSSDAKDLEKSYGEEAMEYAMATAEAYSAWRDLITIEDYRTWCVIREALPRFAILKEINMRIRDYLEETGTMQISDTNTILARILEDSIPFVYERIGYYLEHFLIDEFQDTSSLQWSNFSPLLEESLSHDHDNLIIGDAKQSIYRFRNADSSLITSGVQKRFGNAVLEAGNTPAENRNWRSTRNIVTFNNLIFKYLADHLGEPFVSLYSNTVQPTKPGIPDSGYVDIRYFRKSNGPADPANEADPDGEQSQEELNEAATICRAVPPLIHSLLKRGYRQAEIGVLVATNDAGRLVISEIMEFNRQLPPSEPHIEFISEESLTLDSSDAVRIVIECFRLIQKGYEGETPQDTDEEALAKWRKNAANFIIYSYQHTGTNPTEMVERFLTGDLDTASIGQLLADMKAVTLPSLMETMVNYFVPESLQRSDAAFLAALQDNILEYCDTFPTDMASFLNWWDKTGHDRSISSPEDTDAVNIMTIHKSKGLEFECVILPDININFNLRSVPVVRWVPVPGSFPQAAGLPPVLPVDVARRGPVMVEAPSTGKKKTPAPKLEERGLLATGLPWEYLYTEEAQAHMSDCINKAYVAFTRAISELYVMLPTPAGTDKEGNPKLKNAASLSVTLYTLLTSLMSGRPEPDEAERPWLPDYSAFRRRGKEPDAIVDDSLTVLMGADDAVLASECSGFTLGTPVENVAANLAAKRIKHEKAAPLVAGRYYSPDGLPMLHTQPPKAPAYIDEADDDRVDPRSEGNAKHWILEHIDTAADIRKALETARANSVISRADIPALFREFTDALQSVEEYGWFDGRYRLYRERPVIAHGATPRRPDRMLMRPDGTLEIIDYKFGSSETSHSRHLAQMRRYARMMAQAMPGARINTYLWYVNERLVVPVTIS